MFKVLSRLSFALLALLLAAGPVMAASAISVSSGLTLSAPEADSGSLMPFGTLAALGVVGMAIKVKDVGAIAKKFVRNAQAAAGDYTEGVKQSGSDWETNAAAGEENYKLGVQQAAADGRFGRGVRGAAQKYATNASTKGAQRFGPGVAAAEGDFARGVGPVLDVIRNITLPPRRPKGDPGNQARSQAIGAALRAHKLGKS